MKNRLQIPKGSNPNTKKIGELGFAEKEAGQSADSSAKEQAMHWDEKLERDQHAVLR